MTLQQLLYTVKIAETKSMNKAAAELFISPAGIIQCNPRVGGRAAD